MPGSRGQAELLLDGVVATGVSAGYPLLEPVCEHGVFVRLVDANTSISAVTVKLEASPDPTTVIDANAEWFELASHDFTAGELTALKAYFSVVNMPTKRVRLNLSTLTGGDGTTDLVYGHYQRGLMR